MRTIIELMKARFELDIQIISKLWPLYLAIVIGAIIFFLFEVIKWRQKV